MKRFFKWCKEAKFGLILGAIAFVFILSISLIATNNKKTNQVAKIPSSSLSSSSSFSSSSSSSSSSTINPITKEKLLKPFKVDATISRYFFDDEDPMEIKSQAIVTYQNKVLPSQGVDYTYNDQSFDIMAAFSGKVIAKKNDPMYGLSIAIEHTSGVVAYYCGLTEVNVMQDENVTQNTILGKAGESVINAKLGKHLHFAIQVNNNYINPLKSYDKLVEDL